MNKQQKPIDLVNYEKSISEQKIKIDEKITSLERKLLSLNNKESMINNIINKINIDLENIDPKKFSAVAQIRTTLNKQFETLGLIIDAIIKFEDMIQKYRKILLDIENQKINNVIKMTKEVSEDEADVSKLLLQINQQFNQASQDNRGVIDKSNPLIDESINELKELGY